MDKQTMIILYARIIHIVDNDCHHDDDDRIGNGQQQKKTVIAL